MEKHLIPFSRLILVDFLGSILWFPVWWYTKGLQKVMAAALGMLEYRIKSYGFRIWIKNFFVPMYGYNDLGSRLVSVFMRTVVLIGRLIGIAFEALVYLAGIIVWMVAPPVLLLLALSSGVKGAFFQQVGLG